MHGVAQSWLIYKLTGSATMLGLIGFVSQIPFLLLAIIGGATADSFNRRKIILITQVALMVMALIVALLTITNRLEMWHLFVAAMVYGIANAFDIPARQSFLVGMVGKEDLVSAIAFNSLAFNTARIVGPALGGLLVAGLGAGWCFLINGLSYVALIAALLLNSGGSIPTAKISGSRYSVLAGVKYALSTASIGTLFLLIGLVSLAGMPYNVLIPVFAMQTLNVDAQNLGLLSCASGTGAVLAALLISSLQPRNLLERWVGCASLVFGASLAFLSQSRSLLLSFIVLAIAGFSAAIQMTLSNTFIQMKVPDELRGRVMSIYSMMLIGISPFGVLFAGVIAERAGISFTLMMGGSICLLGGMIFSLRIYLRRTSTTHPVAS